MLRGLIPCSYIQEVLQMKIPRPEHPKPQFQRENWLNLNGSWQFEIDNAQSGMERRFYEQENFSSTIQIPFCPESRLSGIGHTDFLYGIWYKRKVTLEDRQLTGLIRLHFGAVDYRCTVFVNGQKAGEHTGGYISFYLDITHLVHSGENTIVVFAADDTRSRTIPSGKQSERYQSFGCFYTRTTGIWQTVWLEFLPKTHIQSVRYYPDIHNTQLIISAQLSGAAQLKATAYYEGRKVGEASVNCDGGQQSLTLSLAESHLWEPGYGRLYDLKLTYGEDAVTSYFGLRQICLDGSRFLINGKSVFQRLVLDQGFYPEGIYTAPDDSDLLEDIIRSMDMGFNGARLHEKIFEERFLYHCDRMGYLVWGEYPDWGLDNSLADSIYSILPEWLEELERDFNHPAIIGWCPHNETRSDQRDEAIRTVYRITKTLDPTRPCIDASGYFHVETDVFDIHDYEQNPEIFRRNYDRLPKENILHNPLAPRQVYQGQPVFISEYGGIAWNAADGGWGYGEGPQTEQEFLQRFAGLTDALLDNSRIFALCYTQLTDVEQEQNGLYTYDRRPKFNPQTLKSILSRPAAIEQE